MSNPVVARPDTLAVQLGVASDAILRVNSRRAAWHGALGPRARSLVKSVLSIFDQP